MNEESLKVYMSAIKHFIAEKKIRFIVGKINTGIQINITPVEAKQFDIDLGLLQQLLPLFFQVASLILSNDRNSAEQTVVSSPFFSASPDNVVNTVCDGIISESFKRTYYHRITTFTTVLDSLESQYILKPSKDLAITDDIPSIQFIMRTRGSSRIDDNFETLVELSVDDIELLYNYFKEIREDLRQRTKGTIYHIQEND